MEFQRMHELTTSCDILPGIDNFVDLVMSSGQIAVLPRFFSDPNATYSIPLIGPQLTCRNTQSRSLTEDRSHVPALSIVANRSWVEFSGQRESILDDRMEAYATGGRSNLTVRRSSLVVLNDCNDSPFNTWRQDHWAIESTGIECQAQYVQYALNVTYVQGIQDIAYQINALAPQPKSIDYFEFIWSPDGTLPDDFLRDGMHDNTTVEEFRFKIRRLHPMNARVS